MASFAVAGVYPRERGGTPDAGGHVPPTQGLSPRTRGNRFPCAAPCSFAGSIPANAGEPRPVRETQNEQTVYPRERGGTSGATSGVAA